VNAPDYEAVAARANANGIMVSAAGVKEIAGLLGDARQRPALPEGWVLVPVAWDDEMQDAWYSAETLREGIEAVAALAVDHLVDANNMIPSGRDEIAAIVARAYGGSLYPGLGVPGDYPVADVDYRAADAIIAVQLHNGGVAAALEEIVAALTREGRNDEYALTIDHDRLRAAIKAARAVLQAPSASGCPDGCAKGCQESSDCAEWQEAMRLRREQAFYGAGHTDSAHWLIWVEATEWAWKFVRANYFV